jgi:hypothetical protein
MLHALRAPTRGELVIVPFRANRAAIPVKHTYLVLAAVFTVGLVLLLAQPSTTAEGDVILWVAEAPVRAGSWRVVSDTTAAGGRRMEHPNANAPRITAPLASPSHYFDLPINVQANTPYHLWLRGKAHLNFGDNDSVWVQTSGTIDSNGAPTWRIGTTSGTMVNLEDCGGCTISGWGWQDNGYGTNVSGPLLRFATGGAHTIRIQAREDGISLDQLVLSPVAYLNSAPGAARNDTTILPKSGGGTTPSPVTLVRGPYLQQAGAVSTIVAWATRQTGAAFVEYRTGTEPLMRAQATTAFWPSSTTGIPDYYQHEATLTGLRPGTEYQYDLRVAGADPTPGVVDHFGTAPATGGGTIRLVAFGDSGNGSTAQGQIAALMENETFDFAVHTGDIAYSSGTYAQYDLYFFPYYRDWLRRMAIFPSIGNHDDLTGSATPYRRFFVLPRDGASAAFPSNAERFYSVDYGPVHLIALDTEAAFVSPARRQEQLAWLEADLQASQDQPWRIAFFHRPPYSSSTAHGSDLAVRQAFSPLFEEYNVQLVLTGHDHDYERTVPWREPPEDTTQQAVTYVVTGGGGAALYPAGRSEWTAFSRSAHHYVRAIVSPTQATLEAVGTSGTVFDRFVLNLALQEADAAAPQVAIASPSAGAVLSGVETIEVTASDDSRVEKIDLWVDGTQRAIDLTAPYSFSLDTRTLANGSHTIQARAYDLDGRRASSSRTLTVSN